MRFCFFTPAHSIGARLIICLALACIVTGSLDALAAGNQYLWQSRDQFVALEQQDQGPGSQVLPNDHPAEIALDRLTAMLDSIELRSPDSSKLEPLFTKPTIEVLAPLLQKGLHQATRSEDVTFAVIGLHQSLFGFAKSPKVTTGRVFFQGGRLNIIVGIVQRDVNDREDRRLAPFTPGSRQKTAEGDWSLLPHSGQDAFTKIRKDWLAFDNTWQAPAEPLPVVETKGAASAAQAPLPHQHRPQSLVERLTTLNELKNKGLISDEEYRAKRQELLNSL